MKVIEAQRARHVVLRLDRGEELPEAIVRALAEVDVRSGWITGFGTLDAAELAVFDAHRRTYAKARRFEPGGDVVSLSGNVTQLDGSTCVRLFATLARETEAGLSVVAGELMSGRAFAVELLVTALDDAGLARVADDRTGQLTLVRSAVEPPAPARDVRQSLPQDGRQSPPQDGRQSLPQDGRQSLPQDGRQSLPHDGRPSPAPEVARSPHREPSTPSIVEMARAAIAGEPPPPLSPPKRAAEDFSEVYPEVGDMATHFHFGECKIISSDGDKIRLQQLKDLRVREVALSALRTELVSEDPETQRRTFRLLRKH